MTPIQAYSRNGVIPRAPGASLMASPILPGDDLARPINSDDDLRAATGIFRWGFGCLAVWALALAWWLT